MGSFWFLNFCLKCIDLLAWPLLALGYPMCASIRAIETDSYSETKNLISYWILLSLIYLFEYTFLKLLEWFQFWPYLKLLIVFWLVIPDYGRAFNVYNHLVRSCIYLNPRVVISRFNNWKKLFVKKENFLLQAEKYIKENGTEALEQLIADRNAKHCLKAEAINAVLAADQKEMQQNTACSLAAEAIQAVPATERKEMPQTNGKVLHLEQKNPKDLEVIEKKEVPAGRNGNAASSDLPLKENMVSATETKGMAGKDAVDNELPDSSVPKKVQKEWTCAICQVTTQSEITLNGHLQGKKHKAKCEALKAKNQQTSGKFVPAGCDKKTDQSNKKSERAESSSTSKQKSVIDQPVNMDQKIPQAYCIAKEQARPKSAPDKSTLNDAMKQKTTTIQQDEAKGGLNGINALANKSCQPNAKSEESIIDNGIKGKTVTDHEKLQGLQKQGQNVGMNQFNWTCAICNVKCKSECEMATHLNGRMHLACIQSLSGIQQSKLRCILCNVKCTSEGNLLSHLNGRKHLQRTQSLAGLGSG